MVFGINSDADFEEESTESKKKKNPRDVITKQSQKFFKISPPSGQCVEKYAFKFSGKKEIIGSCFLCGRPGLFRIGMIPKQGFDVEMITNRFVCNTHRDLLKSGCKNSQIPFLIAPCMFLKNELYCPLFDFSEELTEKIEIPEQTCCYCYQLQLTELTESQICQICGKPAKFEIAGKRPMFVCEDHSHLIGCNKGEIFTELAACNVFQNQNQCLYYEKK
jgi:hypothetical protein